MKRTAPYQLYFKCSKYSTSRDDHFHHFIKVLFFFLAEDVPTKDEIVCWCKLCTDGQMLTLTLRMSMSEQASVNLSNSWICMNDPVVRDLVEHPEVNLTWSVDFLFHVYNPALLFFLSSSIFLPSFLPCRTFWVRCSVLLARLLDRQPVDWRNHWGE